MDSKNLDLIFAGNYQLLTVNYLNPHPKNLTVNCQLLTVNCFIGGLWHYY